jgi:hypothetical protein
LHWEQYGRIHEDEALQEYDKAMINTDIHLGRQVPIHGRPAEVEDYSWTEHTARRLSRAARIGLKAMINKQGFELR